ncbi:MAG: magnesium and cobalt transporter [Sulfitobacter sp.]|jgi:magnesium and cobalt transporter
MGDSIDPSSGAAQSALDQTDTKPTAQQDGLFTRLRNALRAPERDPEDIDDASDRAPRPVAGFIGMGNLRRMRVEDVAVPRAEIIAVASDIGLTELVEVFQESGLTRLPVFSRTLDTPIGLVHLKDLALNFGFDGKSPRFSLKSMVRPLLYVPPSMPIGVLLQKMQSERTHMALVIDEYGGVDGLVTIEDLIEQVVGEIEDEHDEPEDQLWVNEKPGCYLVQAKAPLDELTEELGLRLSAEETDEEIDTLGGLVFVLLGRVPARGEVIPHDSGAQFEIVDADARKIKRIRVRLSGAAPAAAAAE